MAGGRKSKAALQAELAAGGQLVRIIEPPALLTADQADVWRGIVAAKPADYFDAGSVDLLVAYCKAVTRHRVLARLIDRFNQKCLTDGSDGIDRYEQLQRMEVKQADLLVRLATKMRLSQQAKYRADAAAVNGKRASRARPWQEPGEPDDA